MQAPATSWRKLLADPGEARHIVQLYQDDDFYGEALKQRMPQYLAPLLARAQELERAASARAGASSPPAPEALPA